MRPTHALASLLAFANLVLFPGLAAAETPSFEEDVRPIFKAACFHCHGEFEDKEGGLDVRLARFLKSGGDSGPAIVPGNRQESYLFQRIRDGEMPPEAGHALTADQVDTIGRWIDAGAPTLHPEPETLTGMQITPAEQAHWSYQKIVRPPVPSVNQTEQVQNPIDAFLLARLEAEGFKFSEPAAPAVAVRRLSMDLIGLLPTYEAVESFTRDERPDRWQRLVDELLASPHYGERWGRHWLDVAGYADSDGYTVADRQRDHAWRYRDYVIRSFNNDKPFDQFILEQLAGDELITTPLRNLSAEDAELLTATGFLRMAPDGTGSRVDDANIARNDAIAETIKIVTSSLLGMTVGCAQCHDHRYDPIPQVDYYRFRAIFDPALNWKAWKSPQQRLVSLYTDADRAQAADIEAEAKKVDQSRSKKQQEFIDATFEKELAKLPEEVHELARQAHKTAASKRTAEQKALFKKHPSLNVTAGSLYLYDRKAADELKEMAAKAKAIRATKPVEEFLCALTEPAGSVPESHLFARGDHEQPQQTVEPAGLSVVSLTSELPEIPKNDPQFETTGRRTALAKRLTNRNHPLTARVIVNRIWMHHFGHGLVATPADFGELGSPPTHPALLDWLAVEFIESGWSVKHIHRLIVNSTAYRQALRTDRNLIAADPDNLLYGGSRLQRLDAETLRDAILTVSGQLNVDLYGKPVPVMADEVGRWVLGVENLNAGRPGKVIDLNGRENLRSVYVEVRRSRPLAVLETFDWPRMAPNCSLRHASTGTPQSLMLMNNEFVHEYAGLFARRVESLSANDPRAQIGTAWKLAFDRPPSDSESATAQAFLEEQTALLEQRLKTLPKKDQTGLTARQQALSSLCQMLFSSNEFLYID